jgi:PIN domain nuclease of toxin-antitoxin system
VYLLDTAVLLWALLEPERLTAPAREAIEQGRSMLSVASYWEILLKSKKGILGITDPVSWWERAAILFQGQVLSIRTSHISALSALPDIHRDPFDRILIAQAIAEGMPIIASDKLFSQYPVRVLWKRRVTLS